MIGANAGRSGAGRRRRAAAVLALALAAALALVASAPAAPPREGDFRAYLGAPGAYPLLEFRVLDDIDGQLVPFRKQLLHFDLYWPGTGCGVHTGNIAIEPGDTFRHVEQHAEGQVTVVEARFVTRTRAEGTFFSTLDTRFVDCKLEQPLHWVARPLPLQIPPRPGNDLPTASPRYVALGDSYSSGEGVRPFESGTDNRRNRCHRSKRAYSRVIPEDNNGHSEAYSGFAGLGDGYYGAGNPSFFACSGATTGNIGRLEADGALDGTPQRGEPAIQLDQLTPEQWWFTDMITLTVGGNDSEFAGVLKQCVFRACHRGKLAEEIETRIATEVPEKLTGTYAAIRRLAPNASVFVFGYPQLFPSEPQRRCPIGKRLVSKAKQDFLRERGEQLNAVIRARAQAAQMHFVDVERKFSGHEPCGPNDEWIHALVNPAGRDRAFSFHPNRKGQRAYARRFRSYSLCLSRAGYPWAWGSEVAEIPSVEQPVPAQCT